MPLRVQMKPVIQLASTDPPHGVHISWLFQCDGLNLRVEDCFAGCQGKVIFVYLNVQSGYLYILVLVDGGGGGGRGVSFGHRIGLKNGS